MHVSAAALCVCLHGFTGQPQDFLELLSPPFPLLVNQKVPGQYCRVLCLSAVAGAVQASAKEAKLVANETVAALRMEQEQLRDALHQSRQVEVDADARCVAADKKLAACQETSAGLQQQLRHTMDAYGTALQAKNALEVSLPLPHHHAITALERPH